MASLKFPMICRVVKPLKIASFIINPQKLASRSTFSGQIASSSFQFRPFSTTESTGTIDFRSNRGADPSSDASLEIDAGSSIRKSFSLWPGVYRSPVTNALWEARSKIFEKTSGAEGELVTKTPAQSRTSIEYKFSSDFVLREQYRNPWNEIRMGKLVEDLDALAGTISYKHCCIDGGMMRPLILVTASVDRIVLKKPIRIDADLRIIGAVTWVGRSSMEIQLEVIQSSQDSLEPSDLVALVANFTFVARDHETGKSAPINQIFPETKQEKLLWDEAEGRNKSRKKAKGEEQQQKGIDSGDVERINKLLAEGRVFCDMPALADRDSILIRDTCLRNSLICQPQQRNIHGRIFGGFLMRKAFELAFSTAYTFAGRVPRFVEVDHVDFVKPVDVGNFLRFKSSILYTEVENPTRPLIHIEVVAHVTCPELRSSEVSNKFYFTFTVRPEAMKDGFKIRSVVPVTEEEARRVIERMDAEHSHKYAKDTWSCNQILRPPLSPTIHGYHDIILLRANLLTCLFNWFSMSNQLIRKIISRAAQGPSKRHAHFVGVTPLVDEDSCEVQELWKLDEDLLKASCSSGGHGRGLKPCWR